MISRWWNYEVGGSAVLQGLIRLEGHPELLKINCSP